MSYHEKQLFDDEKQFLSGNLAVSIPGAPTRDTVAERATGDVRRAGGRRPPG
jgi:hypothetical protein